MVNSPYVVNRHQNIFIRKILFHEGIPEDYEEVYYEEPDLTGGVEGIDYTISYGSDEGREEEADN
jgi:hypothetical protein